MAKKHLQRHAHITQNISFWWYEDNGGIDIYCKAETEEGVSIQHTVIPWTSIRAALRRKDKENDK